MSKPTKLHRRELEQALEDYLDPVLSSRRTAEEPARGLSSLSREHQDFALHWTRVIQKSNSEMAYQFVTHAPRALALMGVAGARKWLLAAMDIYDQEGLYPGSAAFAEVDQFAREFRRSDIAISLDEVRPILSRFIRGLSGRDLKLEAGERVFTDTETLFLPPQINRFAERDDNYKLYKATAVFLWAQGWFGTFIRETPESPHLVQRIADIGDDGRALTLFNTLETIRLTACIKREFPGLAREILALDSPPPVNDATWQSFITKLQLPNATVADTVAATATLYPLSLSLPTALAYQGELDLDAAKRVTEQRIDVEKNNLQRLLDELLSGDKTAAEDGITGDKNNFELTDSDNEINDLPELKLDGEPLPMPPELARTVASLLQDLEQLPEDWLTPAGDAEGYDKRADDTSIKADNDDIKVNRQGAYIYDEWDFRRASYRKNWCALREINAHPLSTSASDEFIENTLTKHKHLVREIRRHFEALRGEDKLLKAQPDGEDIDLDALVTAHADMQAGREVSSRLFTRKNKIERDLAVLFMVDVSGSTKGWINDAERESLVLLCEALETLGDQYAIYGFSGMTRNRCEVYRVKTFAQNYDAQTRARISGLRPQDYTRMGVTIRHLTKILAEVEARTRILITLSDGKPDDYDGYRGDYGIEDTRQALLESRHAGIHPFCITIDSDAGEYLPHMYGHASFVVVDEVRKLPLKVADIYRKLTT